MSDYESKVKITVDDSELDSVEKKIDGLKNKKVELDAKVSGTKDIDKLSQNLNTAKKSASGLTDSFKAFAKIGAYINVFQMIEKGAKQAAKAIEDIDTAIVDLQMATGDSYRNVKQLVGGYNDLAKQLGATTTEMASGASDWLRQGKSISETNALLQNSMVLSKVANISSEDSTSYLTAMINGYKKSVEEVNGINDSLTSIDLAAAVDAGGLAEATSRVAASASLAGIELNKLLGYEAAVGEASQESMSVIGNSMKTIFSRMSDIKSGQLELVDEDGTTETLSDVETVLKNIGIPLRDSANEFRDFDDVLDETAKKWEKLSSVQRASVSKAFAGQRQANRFQLLMENYDKALKYEQIANNSSGTAMQKFNDAYLNSLEAKQKSLQASFEGVSTNLISRDTIAGIIEATQALVEFLDKTNLLKGALAGITVGGAMKGFVTLTASITQAAMKMQNFQKALSLLKAGNIGNDEIKQLSALVDGLSESQAKAILSSTQLSTAQRMSILTSMGMSEAEATATLSTMGLAVAEDAAATSTLSLSAAFKGMLSTLLANPIVLMTAAVTAGVAAWSSYKQSVEDTIQTAKDVSSAWTESNNSLNEQIEKYKELKAQLSSGTLSSEEEYAVKQQILDIQTQITSQYGEQVSGVDLVNGSLQTQLGILQQISAENAKKTLNENRDEFKKVEKEMTKERQYNIGDATNALYDPNNSGKITAFGKELKHIVDTYEELQLITDDFGTHIEFTGDASQAEKVINDFMNDVRDASKLDGGSFATAILDSASNALSDNKEIIDNYQESYKTFLQMDMLSKGTGKGSVADTFNKYTDAVEAYNEALMSGSDDAIYKARSDFSELSSDVQNLLSQGDNYKYSTLFDDVTNQLNEASIKAYEFNEALSGKAGNNNQFKKTSGDIQKASDSLKKLKLDAVDVLDALVTDGKQTGEEDIWSLAKAWGITAKSSTEDMQAFVDVLAELGIVSLETSAKIETSAKDILDLVNNTQSVISEISAVTDALSGQSTGKSISLSDFNSDELKDYTSALEYINGTMQLNKEKVADITKVKADEAIAANNVNKALKQAEYLKNAGEIEKLYSKLDELKEGTAEYNETKSRLDSILESNSAISAECRQYDLLTASIKEATSAYTSWLNKQNTAESGDMFNSSLDAMQAISDVANSESEDFGRVGTQRYEAAVEFIVPDTVDKNNAEAVQNYINSIGKYFDYDENGQRVGMNITQFCQDAVNEGLMNIEMDGEGKEVFNLADGIKMDHFAEKLNLSKEMVQAMFGEMQEFGGEFDWTDEAVQTIGDLGVKAYESAEALKTIGDNADLNIQMDVSDIDDLDGKLSVLDGTIQQMNELKTQPGVDASQIEHANDIIQYCIAQKQQLSQPVFMDIDVSQVNGELGEIIGLIQQLQSAQNEVDIQTSIGADTSEAQSKVDGLVAQIQAKDATIKATIGDIDTSSVDTILAGVSAKSAEMWCKLGVEDSAIQNYVPENKTATVTYHLNSSAVDNYNPSNLTRTVTYNIVTNGEAPKANGTAHVDGTAEVKRRIGRALASGSWGINKDEVALTGELGQELVVYGKDWWTVGDKGAEFSHIPKGAIVFNHKQTEEIFKHGYVTSGGGRGKALASGTAYVTGGIGVSNANKTVALGSSSSTTSNSTSDNTAAVEANTDATKDNTEAQKETIDWIDRAIEMQSAENDRLHDAIESFEMHANQNQAINSYISDSEAYMNTLRNAQNAYMSKANALDLDGMYVHNIWAGNTAFIEEIQDEGLVEKINQYKEWYDKAKDIGDQMTELNQKMREAKIGKLDNIKDDYDNLIQFANGISDYNEAVNELYETRNLVGNEEPLTNSINQQEAVRQTLINEYKELSNQLNELVASGDIAEYTDTWLKWKNEINDVSKSIIECDSALEDLKKNIREIRLNDFNKSLDKLDFTSDMASSLRDLMSESGIFGDDVKLTDSGIAQLGLMGTELVSAKKQVANYNVAIDALKRDLKNGNISQAQYNEQLQEYQKSQMDAVKATNSARNAIIDLVKDGIEKETEAMEELISKRKEDLSKQREYYKFQKEMNDKSKEMNNIRAQIAVLQGDDSLESQGKIRKLEDQLKELQDEYSEDQKEHEYDVVQDAYDETLEKFKENQEETIHTLETSLSAQDKAIADMLQVVKQNYNSVYTELQTYATEYNVTLTDSIISPWVDATSAVQQYQAAVGKVGGNVSIDTSKIEASQKPTTNQTTPTKNEAATQNLSKNKNGTWIRQGNGWWYQHDDGSYVTNGWENIDGTWYKFDQNGWMQTGWQTWGKDANGNDDWYLLDNTGAMKTGWQYVNGNWYFMDSSGKMAKSAWIDDKYYVDHTGAMARNGYVKSAYGNTYYWVNENGEYDPQWDTQFPDLSKYTRFYSSGSKNVRKGLAFVDDKNKKLDLASELVMESDGILTDYGVLRKMNGKELVFNEEQKRALWEMSNGNMPVNLGALGAMSVKPVTNNTNNQEINIHYDNLVGNIEYVDKNALPTLETILKKSFEYNMKELKKYDRR